MKAAVIRKPGSIQTEEVPEPVTGPYDALCEILFASVCSGTDNHILRGDPYHNVHFPCILGHESIGRVIAIGEKVKHLKIGDVVTRVRNRMPETSDLEVKYGAFAERGLVTDWEAMRDDHLPEEMWSPLTIHRVIDGTLEYHKAVMIITWRETLSFLTRMELPSKQTVLIIGSGANALAFVEHLRNRGHACIVVGSRARLQDFSGAGAVLTIDYRFKDPQAAIMNAGYESVDVIIDALGEAENVNTFLPLLRDGGVIAVYGLNAFRDYRLSITAARGDFSYLNGEHYDEGSAHDAVIEAIRAGLLDADRYIAQNHIYDLDHVSEALTASHERRAYKPVLKITG